MLLDVRAEVQSSPRIQEVFRRAHDEKWTVERLTDLLITELVMLRGPEEADPTEAARFLADEYTQIGPSGVQLISTVTGKIAVILREEDLYKPAPVPREGTDIMAQPLPRIRPDLETAIVTWFHDKGREERILETLAARGHQTALLRATGDPRLLVATKRGRRHIVESLSKIDPKLLLELAGGRAGTFLRMFHLIRDDSDLTDLLEGEGHGLTRLSGEASAKSVMGVQDPTTTNLHHNRAATLRAALVGGWIRHLARVLALKVHQENVVLNLGRDEAQVPGNFAVVPPDYVRVMTDRPPKVELFAVEGSDPIAFDCSRKLGYIRVPHRFEAMNQDFFDRWEASAYLHFEMWVDLSLIKAFVVHGVETFTQVL
jgi:hypothetical protein